MMIWYWIWLHNYTCRCWCSSPFSTNTHYLVIPLLPMSHPWRLLTRKLRSEDLWLQRRRWGRWIGGLLNLLLNLDVDTLTSSLWSRVLYCFAGGDCVRFGSCCCCCCCCSPLDPGFVFGMKLGNDCGFMFRCHIIIRIWGFFPVLRKTLFLGVGIMAYSFDSHECTVDGRNPTPVNWCSLSCPIIFSQVLHIPSPKWLFGISSINSL